MEMKPDVLVLHSGGLDSSVLLYRYKALGKHPLALHIHYGQRHDVELDHALEVCEEANIPSVLVSLPGLKAAMKGGSQTDDRIPVPEGHYTDPSMRATVSPNRNMILLSLAGGVAISHGINAIAYAAHAGDHPIYPDCRPEFFEAMRMAFTKCHYDVIAFDAPFINMSKAEIVLLGSKLRVPFELTWSCYKGEDLHCGLCGTCVERREAFSVARVPDPTEYSYEEQAMFEGLRKHIEDTSE